MLGRRTRPAQHIQTETREEQRACQSLCGVQLPTVEDELRESARGSAPTLPTVPIVLPDKDERRRAALKRQHTARRIGEKIGELETELEEDEDEQAAMRRFREAMSALDIEEGTMEMALAILRDEGMPAVQVFVKGQLANAAAENLRLQKVATEAFAKDFLVHVLQNEKLPSQFGRMLERIFKDGALSTGVRHLIYNAIALDHTYRNALRLTRAQVTWLLTGTDWMDEYALRLCILLLAMEQTEIATMGIVAWAVSTPGMLDGVASRSLASSLPYGSETLTQTMVAQTCQTLESEWAHELAKSTTLSIIQDSLRSGHRSAPSQVKASEGDKTGGDALSPSLKLDGQAAT